jgi:hypothetical protein
MTGDLGSAGDTVADRMDSTPALRFVERGGTVWLVKRGGTSYAFAGKRDMPAWGSYYHRMADAVDFYLNPPPEPELGADELTEPAAPTGETPAETTETDAEPGVGEYTVGNYPGSEQIPEEPF